MAWVPRIRRRRKKVNSEEFEKLVEKLREVLVDEPTTSRYENWTRAYEGDREVLINISNALPGSLLRIVKVYYFKLFDGWVAPDTHKSAFNDFEVAQMCRDALDNGARVDLLNWPEE
nr:MAG TPA: hypothetical protein [Caudoviricetes sp.]